MIATNSIVSNPNRSSRKIHLSRRRRHHHHRSCCFILCVLIHVHRYYILSLLLVVLLLWLKHTLCIDTVDYRQTKPFRPSTDSRNRYSSSNPHLAWLLHCSAVYTIYLNIHLICAMLKPSHSSDYAKKNRMYVYNVCVRLQLSSIARKR